MPWTSKTFFRIDVFNLAVTVIAFCLRDTQCSDLYSEDNCRVNINKELTSKRQNSDTCGSAELREIPPILNFSIKDQAKKLRVAHFYGAGP